MRCVSLLTQAAVALAVTSPAAGQTLQTYSATRQFHGEARLVADVEFGAGTLRIGPGPAGSLYRMQASYDRNRYDAVSRWDGARGAVTLGLRSRGEGGIRVSSDKELAQSADIRFSPQADLDLTLELGAAKSVIELGGLRLAQLSLETGASQTDVLFSQPNPVRCTRAAFSAGAAALTVRGLGNSRCEVIRFDGGVGSVMLDFSGAWPADARFEASIAVGGLTLRVPKRVGVRLQLDKFLASFQPAGFVRQGNTYLSENYATAERHLDVKVSTSFGGLAVEWIE
jgi:hypothetical protein